MTPFQQYKKVIDYFTDGWTVYHFSVPLSTDERYYIQRMREYAKRDKQSWKIAHNIGRAWIVKQKTPSD